MNHTFLRFTPHMLFALFLFAGLASDGQARPLKKEVCKALAAERTTLAKKDVIDALLKGPEWSRSNIPADAIQRIRRYLEVEEQLRFRCRGMKVPLLSPEETETASVSPKKGAAPAKRVAKGAIQKKKPATKQSIPSAIAPSATSSKVKQAKPQPRPKLGAITAPKPKLLDLTIPKEQVPAVALMPLPEKRPAPPVRRAPRTSSVKKKPEPDLSDNFGANALLRND